jgi:hypothetical protein
MRIFKKVNELEEQEKRAEEFAEHLRHLGLVTECERDSGSRRDGQWTIRIMHPAMRIVLKWTNPPMTGEPSELRFPSWESRYLVPHRGFRRLRSRFAVRTIFEKSFPVLGETIGFRWGGNDAGTGVLKVLSNDKWLTQFFNRIDNLYARGPSLKIIADRREWAWSWSGRGWEYPTQDVWQMYLTLAKHLDAARIPTPSGTCEKGTAALYGPSRGLELQSGLTLFRRGLDLRFVRR